MEEWRTVRIGDICSIRRGASPRPIQEYLSPQGVPWVKISDATASNSRFISQTAERIKEEGRGLSLEVFPGDLILSNSATPGIPKFMNINACIHDGWLLLRDFRDVTKEYLFYNLLFIRTKLVNKSNGSVFNNLKTDIVKDFEINLPPKKIQNQITEILSSLDDKIELNRQMNQTLEEMAKAFYLKLFCLKENESAPITEFIELNPKVKIANGTEVKFVEMADLPQEGSSIQNFCIKEFTSSGSKFQNLDTLFARITPCLENGKTGFVDFLEHDESAFGSTEFIVLRGKKGVSPYYVYLMARMESFRRHAILSMVGTSGRQRVQNEMLCKFEIEIPNKESMSEFHSFVEPLFNLIKSNSEEIKHLSSTRDYLIPKLISGEVLPKDLKQVEEVL